MDDFYAESTGLSPKPFVPVLYSEEQFDGDFDSASAEITRMEASLEFVSTYEEVQKLHSHEKIRMCKRLQKALGRGVSKYHESAENYLDAIMSREDEGNAAPAENNNAEANKEGGDNKPADKPNADNSKKKEAWYHKLWNFIKKIFTKIWGWIKARFKDLKNLFTKDKEKKVDNALKDPNNGNAVNNVEKNMESNSEYFIKPEVGIIPINGSVASNLTRSVADFSNIVSRFAQTIREMASRDGTEENQAAMRNKMNEVISDISKVFNVNVGAGDTGNAQAFMNHMKNVEKAFNWKQNPAGFTKTLCGTDFVKKSGEGIEPSKLVGTTKVSEGRRLCAEMSQNLDVITGDSSALSKAMNAINAADTSINSILNKAYAGGENNTSITDTLGCITACFKVLTRASGTFRGISMNIASSINTYRQNTTTLTEKLVLLLFEKKAIGKGGELVDKGKQARKDSKERAAAEKEEQRQKALAAQKQAEADAKRA